MTDDELSRALADGRVITVREHLRDLRREDQRAVELLGKEVNSRLDTFSFEFKELRSSVDQFHSAYSSQQKQLGKENSNFFSIATLAVSIIVGGIMIFLYMHK